MDEAFVYNAGQMWLCLHATKVVISCQLSVLGYLRDEAASN